jgi:hypothetical protein
VKRKTRKINKKSRFMLIASRYYNIFFSLALRSPLSHLMCCLSLSHSFAHFCPKLFAAQAERREGSKNFSRIEEENNF